MTTNGATQGGGATKARGARRDGRGTPLRDADRRVFKSLRYATSGAARLLAVALMCAGALPVRADPAPPVAPAAAATRPVVVGPLSLRVPAGWVKRDGPAADNPHYDAPGPARGLGPSVAIAIEDARPDDDGGGETTILKRERRTVAGRPAIVTEWRSEEGDSQGVTIAFDGVTPGKTIMVLGWTPRTRWAQRSGEIWAVLDTIAIAGAPAAAQAPGTPAGPVRRLEVGDTAAVVSGPRAPAIITVKQPIYVRALRTYHWNDGRGARPGAIHLKTAAGAMIGPFPARGEPGQGGVPNAYWTADVNQWLEPGAYTLATSNDATWSTNEGVRWRGFYTMDYQRAADPVAEAPQTAAPQAPRQEPRPHATPQTSSATPVAPGARTLFAGDLADWEPLSAAGGDFKTFARLENGALVVDVPAGHGWGKTGLRSKKPLVRLDPATPGAARLTFAFDPARTTAFVVALASRDEAEEWTAHDARVAWSRTHDGAATLTLWIAGQVAMAARCAPEAPRALALTISSNGDIRADIAGGRVEGMMPAQNAARGLRVFALAHAAGENTPARMALTGVALAAAPDADPARDAQAGEGRVTLFAGALDGRWMVHQMQGGDFAKHARLSDDGLVVAAPKDSGWAKVGVRTQDPAIWLDDWRDGAHIDVDYQFDPERTTGFVVGLSAVGAAPGADPEAPTIVVHWRRRASGGGRAALALPPSPTPTFQVETLERAPAQVRLRLTPEGVRALADGLPDTLVAWDALREGQGLRLWAYAQPDQPGEPVRMALSAIVVDRVRAPALPARSDRAATAAARRSTVLFDGAQTAAWTPIGVGGGDFARFATWDGDRLTVDAPAGAGWGRTGLVSAEPVADLGLQFAQATYRLTVEVDPKATTGFAVALGPEKAADMAPTNRLWVSVTRDGDGAALTLDRTRAQSWTRRVSAAFMDRWDGRLIIDLAADETIVRMGAAHAGDIAPSAAPPRAPEIDTPKILAPRIRAPAHFDVFDKLYLAAQSHPVRENQPARMVLRRVTAQWIARGADEAGDAPSEPSERPADAAASLHDAGSFDADAFLKGLAAGATRAPDGAVTLSADEAAALSDAPALAHAPKSEPAKPEPPPSEKSGALWDILSIGRASAQTAAAPECAKAIADHIDAARKIDITLGDQADLKGQLVNLGLTLLGKTKFEDDTLRETLRANADRIVNAVQDAQAVAEDWSEDRTADMVSHFMQGALKLGLTSNALGDERGFRQARKHVKDVWYEAIRKLPEDRARALIAEMSASIKTAIPNHDLYKEILDKGRDVDFGAAFGQGAQGETKAMLWSLSNTALAAFLPEYAIAKEVGATIVESAKTARNFVVNESVRQLYSVWKEEIAKNGGQESRAFYDARTTMGYFPALETAKAMMRARDKDGAKKTISNDAAEAFLFRQFDGWFKADEAAAKTADSLGKAQAAFAGLKCRAALEREVAPQGPACARELQLFKRYADLNASVRGRILSWMQRGGRCDAPQAIDGQTDFLVCQLLDYGEAAYKKSLGAYLQDCGLLNYAKDRNDAAARVRDRLPKLSDERLKAVLDRAGVAATGDFMNCLCPNGFHYFNGPEAKAPCRRIGPLGGASWAGFNPQAFESCSKAYPLKDGRSVIDAVADTLTGIHIDQK